MTLELQMLHAFGLFVIKNIIGFFGDSMQSIYDDGIGDLNNYKDDITIDEFVNFTEANGIAYADIDKINETAFFKWYATNSSEDANCDGWIVTA